MAASSNISRRLFVVGANHRSSGLGLRDRLFVEDADVPAVLDRLVLAGITEAMVLSTCDRIEIIGTHAEPALAETASRACLARHAELEEADLGDQLYFIEGDDTVRHLYSVTSSLDSLVIGEPQVFGQVKAAHRMARDHGTVSSTLEGVLQAAYGAAKRVRTETAIGERPTSIAAAACEIARGLHGDLRRLSAILIGVGEMGELIARQFQSEGVDNLSITHPTAGRADHVARELGCHVTEFETLSDGLAEADVVICALGSRRHSLSADMVRAALKRRRNRPQFIIDTAIPGDVEPAVNRIDEAFLYDIGDLEQVAMEGRANREQEAKAAWEIIDAEVAATLRDRAERDAVPAVTALREHFETARADVLGDNDEDAERATRRLVNRLLHAPSKALRELAAANGGEAESAEKLLARLFGIGRPTGDPEPDEETKE